MKILNQICLLYQLPKRDSSLIIFTNARPVKLYSTNFFKSLTCLSCKLGFIAYMKEVCLASFLKKKDTIYLLFLNLATSVSLFMVF